VLCFVDGGTPVDHEPAPQPVRTLAAALRITGVVMLLAAPAVFMPRAWMSETHARLGMGALPEGPIVEYLARSLSMLYATCGALCCLFSTDVRRFAPAILLLVWLGFPGALVLTWIDVSAGMPWHWRVSEGPIVLTASAVLLWLCRRAGLVRAAEGSPPAGAPPR